MDRDMHKKHPPCCPQNVGMPDQYMWPVKDTNTYPCRNGVSHPIYECNGNIHYSLPLHMYPKVNKVHSQIALSPQYKPLCAVRQRDIQEGRISRFYTY